MHSIPYDPGEAFAVSIERVILDKLKEPGKLQQYGLSEYIKSEEIEQLWKVRRIDHYAKDFGIVGHTSDGKELSDLDLDLLPYDIMKNKGMEKMVQYLKCQDFYKIESFLPRKGDEKAITKFCDDVKNGNYDECLIQNTQNYQPIFSKEDIISTLQALRNNRAGEKEVTQINPEKSQDESNKHNSNPQTSSNNRFVEDVKENISENATISGINHEIQHIKSKAIDKAEEEKDIGDDVI